MEALTPYSYAVTLIAAFRIRRTLLLTLMVLSRAAIDLNGETLIDFLED